jgi:hypothetical protein
MSTLERFITLFWIRDASVPFLWNVKRLIKRLFGLFLFGAIMFIGAFLNPRYNELYHDGLNFHYMPEVLSISPDQQYQICTHPKYAWRGFITLFQRPSLFSPNEAMLELQNAKTGKTLYKTKINSLKQFKKTGSITWFRNYVSVKTVSDWKLPIPIQGLKNYLPITPFDEKSTKTI